MIETDAGVRLLARALSSQGSVGAEWRAFAYAMPAFIREPLRP